MKVAQEASLLGKTKSEQAKAASIASHVRNIFRELLMFNSPVLVCFYGSNICTPAGEVNIKRRFF
jgi:hypothetical protein